MEKKNIFNPKYAEKKEIIKVRIEVNKIVSD